MMLLPPVPAMADVARLARLVSRGRSAGRARPAPGSGFNLDLARIEQVRNGLFPGGDILVVNDLFLAAVIVGRGSAVQNRFFGGVARFHDLRRLIIGFFIESVGGTFRSLAALWCIASPTPVSVPAGIATAPLKISGGCAPAT
jgi:hypothetical protein